MLRTRSGADAPLTTPEPPGRGCRDCSPDGRPFLRCSAGLNFRRRLPLPSLGRSRPSLRGELARRRNAAPERPALPAPGLWAAIAAGRLLSALLPSVCRGPPGLDVLRPAGHPLLPRLPPAPRAPAPELPARPPCHQQRAALAPGSLRTMAPRSGSAALEDVGVYGVWGEPSPVPLLTHPSPRQGVREFQDLRTRSMALYPGPGSQEPRLRQ